jgi:Auxiliary Activity family 9 (formerly GH61)
MVIIQKLAWIAIISQVAAHSGMSNFYVNGVNQGDAVCVRMNKNPDLWTNPVNDLSSTDMACGFNGSTGVNRVCPVPDGATLTFEWREVADKPGQGVIDISHMGPCAVCVCSIKTQLICVRYT